MINPRRSILKDCLATVNSKDSTSNYDSAYCFSWVRNKSCLEPDKQWKMDKATIEQYIIQQIVAQKTGQVVFAWQESESSVRDLEFYRQVVALQSKHGQGKQFINILQTNGLLLNEEWCFFLKSNNFRVEVLIDGPKELHDTCRELRGEKGTHDNTIATIQLIKQFNIEFYTLTTVSDVNARSPQVIYRYLKGLGSKSMQFAPLVEKETEIKKEGALTLSHSEQNKSTSLCEWSVDGKQYGLFMSAVFYEWVRKDVGEIWIKLFESTFALTCNRPSPTCTFSPMCDSLFTLEGNCASYACGCSADHKDNVYDSTINSINHCEVNRNSRINKYRMLSDDCQSCDYLSLCYGGCPKHRFSPSSSGKLEQNYLCAGYKTFFSFSEPYFRAMKKLLQDGYPAEAIMKVIEKKKI